MKKKFMCVFLLLFSISIVFAEEKANQEMGYAKKLLYETARILESKNNMVVVDEISNYDWYWGNDVGTTSPYINTFNNTLTENKLIDQQRIRLNYLYNQEKASLVSALVPNALHFVNIAMNAENPLKAMIAIGGATLSSFSNFLSEKQQQDLDLIQKQWKFDDLQVKLFEHLSAELRTYLAQQCSKYGISNEQLASIKTLRKFVKLCNEYDYNTKEEAKELLLKLDTPQFNKELAEFPEYWAEKAKAAYGAEEYNKSLQYIDQFEHNYVQTMYHDDNRSLILKIKAFCLLQENAVDITIADKLCHIADDICNFNSGARWEDLYFCVELYEEMNKLQYSNTRREQQIVLMKQIVNEVADEYKENLDNYLSGKFLEQTKEGIENHIENLKDQIKKYENANLELVGKTTKKENKDEIKKLKGEIKTLRKNKETAERTELQILPPNSSLLYSVVKRYKDMCDASVPEDKTLMEKCSRLLCDIYSQNSLFGSRSDIKQATVSYNKHSSFWNNNDELKISIPATYFVFTSGLFEPKKDKLSLEIANKKYDFSSYTYEVQRAGNNLDNVNIVFTCKVEDVPIDKGEIVEKVVDVISGIYPTKLAIESIIKILKEQEKSKDRAEGEAQSLSLKIYFVSYSMQIENPIIAVVDNPSQMLKSFQNKE